MVPSRSVAKRRKAVARITLGHDGRLSGRNSWPSAWPVGIILGLCGLAGLVNQVYVILKQFKMNIATLDWLDWALFSAVPALG